MEGIGGVDREFKSCPPSQSLSIDWQQFHNFLMQRMTAKTAGDRISYAKQYAHIFWSGPDQLLQFPPNKDYTL